MNQVNTFTEFADLDQLDGVTLVDGELLDVEFPDGVVERHRIRVKSWIERAGVASGRMIDTPFAKAYVEITYRTKGAWIRLPGLWAKRVTA